MKKLNRKSSIQFVDAFRNAVRAKGEYWDALKELEDATGDPEFGDSDDLLAGIDGFAATTTCPDDTPATDEQVAEAARELGIELTLPKLTQPA